MNINLGLTADATGTVDIITATYSLAPTLVDKKILFLVASGANTSTTPSFAPNGLAARTIVKNGGVALAAGDIQGAGHVLILEYNLANTRWELLNPSYANSITSLNAKRSFTTRLHAAGQNPADNTSYFLSVSNNLAPLTAALRWGICPIASTAQIVSIQVAISGTLAASGQFVTVTLHNKTQATSQVLTNQFPHDAVTNLMVVSSTLAFNANDEYYIELAQPAWAPNPTNVFYSVETNFRT